MSVDLSPKRLQQLQEPYVALELKTIEEMVRLYCHAKHGGRNLCPSCQDFLDYATKRLACCPFGAKKPVCQKCKSHCFGGRYKELAKEIMAFSGPRLILKRPDLLVRHIIATFREAPEKPKAVKKDNT